MTPDWLLLRRYAKDNSQDAFAELTARYLNLVYSVSLREVHDPDMAQDVTQAVFLLLARTAPSFRSKTALPGWLFRTARFAAQNARTREGRRRHYEEKAAQMMQQRQEGNEEAAWGEIEPVLNQSLAALKTADRECVLLRFFQGLSFAELGSTLGLSEEAARKRVSRSLEKMQRFLTKEGVVLTSAALAGLLLSHAAKAAPAPVAVAVAQLTAGVVSGSVSLLSEGVSHAMKIAKMKIAASAAALVLVGTAATYGVVRGALPLLNAVTADSTLSPSRTVTLTGRVHLADGSPVGGAHVCAQLQNADMEKMNGRGSGLSTVAMIEKATSLAHTRPDGTYSLYVGEGMGYNVYVVPEDLIKADDRDSRLVAAAVEGVSGTKGATVQVPDLVLTPGGFVIGTVTDASGKPLGGVSVGSYGPQRPTSGAVIISTRTDAQGRYRLRVAPGQSRVYVADGRYGNPGMESGVTITVAEGETKTADFRVTPAKP